MCVCLQPGHMSDDDFWDVMTKPKPKSKKLRRASSAGSEPQAKAAKAKAKGKSRSKAPPKTAYQPHSNVPCELLHEVYDQMKEHFPPDYDECVERAFNLMSEPGMTRVWDSLLGD